VKINEIGKVLEAQGIFTGGPPELFENAGRLQISTLIREGLNPDAKLLDVGCGCLRAGYWLVRFLDPECYFGIEPNQQMLEAGIRNCLTPQLVLEKKPCFDTNDRFDFSVFGIKFKVVLARSIWTHASKLQIETMLDSFVANCSRGAFFLTSFIPAKLWGRGDYRGDKWIGRSHQSQEPGLIRHSRSWIQRICESRQLSVKELPDKPFNSQRWLKISQAS